MINPVKVAPGFHTANSFNRCRTANASLPPTLAEISPDAIVGLKLTNPESMRLGLRGEQRRGFFFCWLQQFSKFDSCVPGERVGCKTLERRAAAAKMHQTAAGRSSNNSKEEEEDEGDGNTEYARFRRIQNRGFDGGIISFTDARARPRHD